jgi:putative membrane protein
MPMMRAGLLASGILVLSVIWLGPLPQLARESFAAHMAMHIGVVAVAAPLTALGIAGGRWDPVRQLPWLAAPIVASLIELIVVWGWHAPAFHQAARHHIWALVLEQGTFLTSGMLLWMAAIGGSAEQRRLSAGAGVVGLLFTSMHMTLLGALFALANRPLFQHAPRAAETPALSDQHLGGAIMLIVGGLSYLAGSLWLTARMLRNQSRESLEQESCS